MSRGRHICDIYNMSSLFFLEPLLLDSKLNSINKIFSIESGNSPEESDLKTFAPQ